MSSESAIALSAAGRHQRPLLIAFGLTATFMIVEVIAGLASGSVALLSDALHMGTDVLGLGMALAAVKLAKRTAPAHRTFGTYRLEILAALANGVLLFAVAIYILIEAWQRVRNPEGVTSGTMLIVAIVGLIINLISFKLLTAGAKESINVKGAFFEVLSDLLGSIGVIIAAIIVALTGWTYADPLIGAAIGLFILPRTWRLTGQAVRILMEAAPPGMDIDEVRSTIAAIEGVSSVHDVHVWTLTSGLDAAAVHVIIEQGADLGSVLTDVHTILAARYNVVHATIQVEPEGFQHPTASI
ncbi:MAG TPA: cation diffusion facilitator family transporter [Miltoncostaeales bacterium]|jgi:cobalt-zinc-cadmium efflux system protein|nr:cation transporter [Acidimicrobiaceae bacterium]HRC08803.1 cation diffusion facilitator family transporter [Miltoncostaeales bacterium]